MFPPFFVCVSFFKKRGFVHVFCKSHIQLMHSQIKFSAAPLFGTYFWPFVWNRTPCSTINHENKNKLPTSKPIRIKKLFKRLHLFANLILKLIIRRLGHLKGWNRNYEKFMFWSYLGCQFAALVADMEIPKTII